MLSFGPWAPAIYLLVYGQPIIPLPASVMIITAGLVFGPLWGTAAALTGSTVRACGQLLMVRVLGRRVVSRLVKGRLARLNDHLGRRSFRTVLLIRLIPNFPFDVQNYGLGLSQVRVVPFAAATMLGMVPATTAFVYLGYSLTDLRAFWKLGVAILLIAGLVIGQRLWKRRHGPVATVTPVAAK